MLRNGDGVFSIGIAGGTSARSLQAEAFDRRNGKNKLATATLGTSPIDQRPPSPAASFVCETSSER